MRSFLFLLCLSVGLVFALNEPVTLVNYIAIPWLIGAAWVAWPWGQS